MRVYFNEKKERLEYYFDISLGNGIDEESKIPYYDDLYTDIVMGAKEKIVKVLDEDELQDAFDTNKISVEEFNLANQTRDLLLDEIKNKTNSYINMNIENYL